MNLVDAAILLAVLIMGWVGWREGFLRALWASTGFFLGAAAGIALTPVLLAPFDLTIWVSLAAVLLVGIGAFLVRALALWLERRARARTGVDPDNVLDRPAGSVFAVVVTLMVSWMLGLALAGSTLPSAGPAANGSAILRQLNALPLPLSHNLVRAFVGIGRDVDYRRWVDPLAQERIVSVPAPDSRLASNRSLLSVERSVLKVTGFVKGMSGKEGTAFVVGPGRLVTAAHVVSETRSDSLRVQAGGRELPATIVACDPRHDVAVLAAPDLRAPVLRFERSAAVSGDDAAALGYPGDGAYTVTPTRVRDQQTLQAADIHDEGRYDSEVYSLRGRIAQGDSGGPLVTPDGRVLGVVIAFSRNSRDTAYALTAQQIAPVLADGLAADASQSVSCDG